VESFDYIVVGAVSAGCVLAHRLAVNPPGRCRLLPANGLPGISLEHRKKLFTPDEKPA
jgi:hypothetical protein